MKNLQKGSRLRRQGLRNKNGGSTSFRKQGSHSLPSREGLLIQLLAGLLTFTSTVWPPSRLCGQWQCGQPSVITVAGPCRILTGFPIEPPRHQKQYASQIRRALGIVKKQSLSAPSIMMSNGCDWVTLSSDGLVGVSSQDFDCRRLASGYPRNRTFARRAPPKPVADRTLRLPLNCAKLLIRSRFESRFYSPRILTLILHSESFWHRHHQYLGGDDRDKALRRAGPRTGEAQDRWRLFPAMLRLEFL